MKMNHPGMKPIHLLKQNNIIVKIKFISKFKNCSQSFFLVKSRLIFFEFPVGVKSICIDGKKYTRDEFEKAKKLELRRGKKGRFLPVDS